MLGKVAKFTALMLLLNAFSAAAQTAVTISQVLRAPSTFNRQPVAVSGRVKDLRVGNGYDTFRICETSCLEVLAWGHPRIEEGQELSVRGRFKVLRHLGHHQLRNLIEVERGSL